MKKHVSDISYSIVIPVFNTTRSLGELTQRIAQIFSNRIKETYEIILVDDCSPNPGTWSAIEELVKKNAHVNAILLDKNSGQHAALLCGMDYAKGKYILTMDDDLQQAPEDIPVLISLKGHDVVMAQFLQKKHSFARNVGSAIKAFFDMVFSGKPRNLRVTSFCLIQRGTAEKMLAISRNSNPLFSSMIFQVTKDVVGAPVSHSSRQEGKSGYSYMSLAAMFSRIIFNNLRSGSRTITWVGSLIFGLSFVLLIGLIVQNNFYTLSYLGLSLLLCIGLVIMFVGIRGLCSPRNKIAQPEKPYIIKQRIN